MTPFKYEPLAKPSTIRVVLLPATDKSSGNEKLQLILQHKELSEVHKQYYALSYVWGNPEKVHTIGLNGQDFQVTENLIFFLRRKRTVTLTFWIDAICINQDDKAEKSEQIARMAQIYENASAVYADLGPASENEQFVFGKMEYLSTFISAETQRIVLEKGNTNATVESMRLPPEFVEPYDALMWEGLGSFFSRPWWNRVWIVQEATAISSKYTRLLCGEVEVLLAHAFECDFAMALASIRQVWGSMPEPSMAWEVVTRIKRIEGKRQRKEVIPLIDVLEDFRGLLATDPRDIIYAALNIASDLKEGDIQADYTTSVANVYRAVAVHYLKNAVEPLRILSHCGTRVETPDFQIGWASWVPSWHDRYIPFILRSCITGEDGSQRPAYNPCGIAQFSAELYPVRVEENVLMIHGFLIDRLTSLRSTCVQSIGDDIQINSWVPEGRTALYRTGETVLDAFLKTVVADLSGFLNNRQRGGKALWDIEKGSFAAANFDKEYQQLFGCAQFRRLAYSTNGYMALVSHQAKEGDLLYALFGGSVLYVLRPEGERFIFVGECYVHGLMDGEAIQLLETGQAVKEVVSIV